MITLRYYLVFSQTLNITVVKPSLKLFLQNYSIIIRILSLIRSVCLFKEKIQALNPPPVFSENHFHEVS
jgi:hypothetical protein